MEKSKWTTGWMVGLILATLVLPVGIPIGLLNIGEKERKTQSIILIVLGVINILMWIWHFVGHNH